MVRGTGTRPGQMLPIWAKDGETIKAIGIGHPHKLVLPCAVDDVEFKIAHALGVVSKDEICPRRVKIRRPGHDAQVRDLPLLRAIEVHGPDFGGGPVRREVSPDNLAAIRTEERPPVIAGSLGQTLYLRTIGAHQVNIDKERRIAGQDSLVRLRERCGVGMAVGGKDDPGAIRRPQAFGVISWGIGQICEMSALTIGLENIVVLVKIPGIPPRLPAGALRQFFLLFGPGLGISMGGGKEHLIGVRMDPGTGGLADAGGHTCGIAAFQIQQVNLIKGIVRFAFALKNHAFTISAKIALASAPSDKGELVCLGQQACFVDRLGWGRTRVCQPDSGADKHDEQEAPTMRHHDNSPVGIVSPRAVGAVTNSDDIVTATLHLTTPAYCFIYSTKGSARTPLASGARRRHAQEAGIPLLLRWRGW